jgi:2-keto-4-pentenoate hydratase/2-oxohepta-3-ene-1,7-dioic acid hydratase in catechol pathway
MKLLRFKTRDGRPQTGWLQDGRVGLVEGDLFGGYRRLEPGIALEQVQLLPPVTPGKIVCIGRNYPDHAKEMNAEVPRIPMLFLKPPSAVIGPGQPIEIPPQSAQVEYEGELAVVIGKTIRHAQPDAARAAIFGYTIGNDVTARDLQRSDGQWTRAKGFDTFCPLGPWIETELDPYDALLTTHLNGQLRQMTSTRDMVFPVYQLISFISSVMTLEPSDVVLTGTPAGVGVVSAGDVVKVTIEGIGELVSPVTAAA